MVSDAAKLHFLLAGDARVRWGMAAAVGSILRVLPVERAAQITVIDGGLPPDLMARLTERVEAAGKQISFIPFRWPEGCNAPALEGSRLAYARLLASEVIDSDYCLYFDTDLVLREDPTPLFEAARRTPFVPLWAVQNYPDHSYEYQLGRQTNELLSAATVGAVYFNSGFLLINVKAWRDLDVAKRCFALAEQYQFICHDQDALNVLFVREWRELPERWNFQLYERTTFPLDAAALHYSGRNKPWHFGYPKAARRSFLEALAAAGFPRWRPKVNLTEWLRNSRFRPFFSAMLYNLRRAAGKNGVKKR
ncbi:MAG TPA: glycosyltransferase [Opitutaceae bacterium]|nr:glycosyltransferase [Opitutaceae bacterium]